VCLAVARLRTAISSVAGISNRGRRDLGKLVAPEAIADAFLDEVVEKLV
jgi:hypothetical protein